MPLLSDQAYIDLVMKRLGNRTEASLRNDVVAELTVVKDSLESGSFLPWFLEATTNLSLLEGMTAVGLPTNFLREVEGAPLSATDPDGEIFGVLKRTEETWNELTWNSTVTGPPTRFALQGTSLLFYPIADRDYTISFRYYAKTEAIQDSDAQLNPWLQYCPDYLIGLAGASLSEFTIRDPGIARSFNGLASRAKAELVAHHEARQVTNIDYSDSDALVEL